MNFKSVLPVALLLVFMVFGAKSTPSLDDSRIVGTNCTREDKTCELANEFCMLKFCDASGQWQCVHNRTELAAFKTRLNNDMELTEINCDVQSRDFEYEEWQCVRLLDFIIEGAFQSLDDPFRKRTRVNHGKPIRMPCDADKSRESKSNSSCRLMGCDLDLNYWRCFIPYEDKVSSPIGHA